MNADLTFNSVVFAKSFDIEGKSVRRSIARGINTPDELIIMSQPYVDSQTKVAGNRYTARVDRYDIDANVEKILTAAYVVIPVPETCTQAQLDVVLATFKAVVADASFLTNVLAGQK